MFMERKFNHNVYVEQILMVKLNKYQYISYDNSGVNIYQLNVMIKKVVLRLYGLGICFPFFQLKHILQVYVAAVASATSGFCDATSAIWMVKNTTITVVQCSLLDIFYSYNWRE